MATAAEIQAQIETATRELQDSEADETVAIRETRDAVERQRLRRVLDDLRRKKRLATKRTEQQRNRKHSIDADLAGPHMFAEGLGGDSDEEEPPLAERLESSYSIGNEHVTCSAAVVKGEYTWRIGGLSWLVETLQQRDMEKLCCEDWFLVGADRFDFQYEPSGGERGTLAIVHCNDYGVTFRYKIYVKRRGGDFEQWGNVGNVLDPKKTQYGYFGPDVPSDGGASPQGVFGLSHAELLKSEWVEDDAITVKFVLELRKDEAVETSSQPNIKVPPGSINAELSSLFTTGKGSDVTFFVQSEPIKAHSQILCARSEVFDKLLHSGMQESMTKEVQIDDCDAGTFKELIRFVYTDEFSSIESVIEARSDESRGKRLATLQGLLAASHKYALPRLQLWCEAKLCDDIGVEDVCSILCQAHLYDAEQLADACLSFVRNHYEAVVATEKFGTLAREWPEVMVKINLFIGRVQEDRAAPAIEAARRALTGKRKRAED